LTFKFIKISSSQFLEVQMKIMVISASPNADGLTAACTQAAIEGLLAGGAEVDQANLNLLNVGMCQACDRGWGTCRTEHRCQIEDDFQALHLRTCQADGIVLVSPVYWGEMSESAKAFTDRVRRNEGNRGEESRLFSHPVIMVAAAGGTGNGMITCLLSMERWIDHVRARKFDLIPVNRWSRPYKLATIRSASEAMANELKEKPAKPK
jgi:multimeric flavodoxin WrbA